MVSCVQNWSCELHEIANIYTYNNILWNLVFNRIIQFRRVDEVIQQFVNKNDHELNLRVARLCHKFGIDIATRRCGLDKIKKI